MFLFVTIQRIIFLSRLRREIFQIYTNHTNFILKNIERFVRFEKICEISVTKWHFIYYSLNNYFYSNSFFNASSLRLLE